ncbi:ABC transporter [Halomonas sp. DQ26W]|nr:ABC transporter [Halomonas sp. DQ26W]
MPQSDPVTLYDLPAQSRESPLHNALASGGPTLRLATPSAGGLLDGTRIVVVPTPNQPQVYQGARWADATPVLMRNRFIDAFQADGRITRLIHADTPLSADLELTSDLRAFQSEYRDGRPEAVIRLDARLIDTRTRQLVASQRFTQQQPADGTDIAAVVDAFGLAADRLAQDLVDWSVEQMASQQERQPQSR